MIDRRCNFKTLVFIAVFAVIGGLGSAAHAQELLVLEVGDLQVKQREFTAEQFDALVDQTVRRINDQDHPERGRLNEQLTLKLDWIEAACKTSEDQRKKLQIAGRGDIKRFFDEMRELKRRYRQVKGDAGESARMQQRLAALQASYGAEIFGDSSLLAKTVSKTLSQEQTVAIKKAEEEARAFAHRAAVEQAVQFCDVAIGLKGEQRGKLTELFVSRSRQIKRYEKSGLPLPYSMVVETARSSRDKLKAIFDERQWRMMTSIIKQMQSGDAVGFGRIPANGVLELRDLEVFDIEFFIVPEPQGVANDANKH